MLCGDEVLYLDRLDSPYPLVASVAIGRRTPAHQVASGKAMLAFQPDIADILLRLEQRGKTTEEVQAIALELATVRQRGFATSSNASVAGMTAVAAPVQSRFGPPKFAIGVGGVSDRFGAEQLEQVVRAVMNAALGISEALGEA
jgi:DNA-binding IclR family transcriptional regulator